MRTDEELKRLQELSLEDKIATTKLRIMEWYEYWKGQVYVSYSGGKDSTVLLAIAREIYPDIPAVFIDTGLEYPEIKAHVKATDNVSIVRPAKSFKQVVEEYGYVYPSKETSVKIYYAKKGSEWAKLCMDGLNRDGSFSKFRQRYKKWRFLIDSPFKISNMCCMILKKRPIHAYGKATNRKPIIATMTDESSLRKRAWLQTGCNAFEAGTSKPMSFWTEQDVLKYIKDNNIRIASVYGDIIEEKGKLKTTGVNRTGCIFCPVGCHLDKAPNRFQQLKQTHPKIWDYCFKSENGLHMDKFLDYIGVVYE